MDNVPTTGNIELRSTKDYIRPTIITTTKGNSKPTNKIGHKKQSNLGAWLNIREPTTINHKLTFNTNRATPNGNTTIKE